MIELPCTSFLVYSVILFVARSSRPILLAGVSVNHTFPSRSATMWSGFVVPLTGSKGWKLPLTGRFHRVRLVPEVAAGLRRRIWSGNVPLPLVPPDVPVVAIMLVPLDVAVVATAVAQT